MKSTVFLAVPNHVFAADLLRTKYIECLVSKYKVVVLTPFMDHDRAARQRYYQSPDVFYVQRKLENPGFWDLFKFLRVCLVNEFDYLDSVKYWYLRPNYKNNWKRRLIHFLGKPFSGILTASFFARLESLFVPKSSDFNRLVWEYKPTLIITATPGFDPWEAEIILLSRKASVLTVAVDFSWDNLTMNSKHIRKTDYLVAWNEIMKKEAIGIHKYTPNRVFVSGVPRFDPYFDVAVPDPGRDKFISDKGLNPKFKTIFHTTVTRTYPFQKKYIRDLINFRDEGKIPYVNIFVRVHPLDRYENYQEFLGLPGLCLEKAVMSNKFSDVEMDYRDLLNLGCSLKYSDLNINYASTISIESCVFDKPIINIGYMDWFKLAYGFNHYLPIYESGAVRLAKNDDELVDLINTYLANPNLDAERRRKIVNDYVGFTDGLSYQRSVDFLEQIARS